jgi:predicted transposase YdaD
MEDLDHNTRLYNAKEEGREEGMIKGREEGREEGMIKGREEGREEGMIKGREEGREEGMIDVALKLFDENFSIMKISEFTGLSINKLQNLFFSGK